MSYVDRYAAMLREAGERRAQPAPRLRRVAPRAAIAALAAATVVAAAAVVPGLRTGERVASPTPPDDPVVVAYVSAVLNSDVRRAAPCLPPRRGAKFSSAQVGAAMREAFGVLRRPGTAPPHVVRGIRQLGDPRSVLLTRSVRLLRRSPRYVLFVLRGPSGALLARDPRRCAELRRAELDRRSAGSSDEVRAGARAVLDGMRDDELRMLADREDRLFFTMLDRRGRVTGYGGGLTAAQARRTGTGGGSIVRVGGRRARSAYGIVPDGVAEVEIVARGAGERPWVRRHRVRAEDNFFYVEGFHAQSFRVRWLDASGREIDRG